MTTVYIPTYGRPDRQPTAHLMSGLGFSVCLCVRANEMTKYTEANPAYGMLMIPTKIDGLRGTRQYILEHVHERVWIMADDDIRKFSYKKDPSVFGGLKEATKGQAKRVILAMLTEALLYDTFAGSIPDRYTVARPSKVKTADYGFMRQFLVIRNLKDKARFDRLHVFMDIDFSLQVMKAGVPMAIARNLCVESAPDCYDPKKGGIGPLRAKLLRQKGGQEGYDKAAWKALQKLHPDVVKVEGTKHRIDWHGASEAGKK